MTSKQIQKSLLLLLAFIIISASAVVSITVVSHDCCAVYVEEYCTPCVLIDKLRNTLQQGIGMGSTSMFALSALLVLTVLLGIKNHPTYNLVELKVRMNN
ncbi:MAG: hypothetical protein FWC73_13970 [Defluviitaleaceae bacterium]|nr:hypothetical protein [Defluviitaleaceae bacterium]